MSDTDQKSASPVIAADPWTAGLELVREALRFVGDERATGPIRKAERLELDLLEELRKPREEQDDAKIMALRQEIPVVLRTATSLLRTVEARKP